MTIDTILTFLGALGVVATFIAGIVQYRRSAHIEIFRRYADKYNEILTADIYDNWQAALSGEKDYWAQLTPTMIEYLNLIWEEFYLVKSGRMPKDLWRLWLPEIKSVLSSDFAKATIDKYKFHFPEDLTGLN